MTGEGQITVKEGFEIIWKRHLVA